MKKGESSGLGVKEPKMYFGDKQQEAVIKYKYSTNQKERDSVYTKILHKPFMQMTAAIIRRYPIHIGRYYMEDLECMALSHLIENFENFDKLGTALSPKSVRSTRLFRDFRLHNN